MKQLKDEAEAMQKASKGQGGSNTQTLSAQNQPGAPRGWPGAGG